MAKCGADLKWALEHLREEKATRVSRTPLLATAAAIAGLLLGVVTTILWLRQPAAETRTWRLPVNPPPGAEFHSGSAVSPDGRLLAFVATTNGKASLWVRPLDSLSARELPGTEGASLPFWSPDSKSLGFFAAGKLKRIDVAGGAPQVLCDVPSGRGGTWSAEGVILFAPNTITGLQRVPASGGIPTPATSLDVGQEIGHRWPQFLPDSRRFLYFVQASQGKDQGVYAGSLDDANLKVRLVNTGYGARYAPRQGGHPGYLLWVRGQTLMAQPFEARTLRLEGEATRVAEGVGLNGVPFLSDFSVSNTGVLLYGAGGAIKSRMVWMNREGKALKVIGPPDVYDSPRLSPDGKRLIVSRTDSSGNF